MIANVASPFRFDGALDMRMNKRAGMTAADIVNTYDEERLANILYLYGELKNSRKLASVIVKARSGQNIRTIGEFLEVIKPLFGREREKKELAKVFQALRIEVKPRDGGVEGDVAGCYGGIKAGRQTGSYHLSFAGKPKMVKNVNEDRQCRRKSGNRLLRQSANAFPPCQQ